MEYDKRIHEIERIAIKYGVSGLLGYEGKFLSKFYEDVLDANVYQRFIGVLPRSGYYRFKSFFIKSISYFVVTIISVFKVRKYVNLLKHKDVEIKDITYVAGPFKIVKAKDLYEVVPEASVYYYPCAGFNYLPQHIYTFNQKDRPLFIDKFQLGYIYSVIKTFICNYRSLKRFSNEIDCIYGTNMNDVIVVLLKSLYFHYHYEGLVKKLGTEQHIWLLEFNSGMEILSLQDSIKRHRPQDITVHMQHGMMLESKCLAYHNPVSDYDIVFGKREEKLLRNKNKYSSIIIGIGCPLQSLGDFRINQKNEERYDILVLLSVTRPKSSLDMQVELLRKIALLSEMNILLRFRPASKKEDLLLLSDYIQNMTVSEGNSLDEDIANSKLIISFSADALYHCFRNQKRSILIVYKYIIDDFSYYKPYSPNLMIKTIDELEINTIKEAVYDQRDVDYSIDNFVKFNFGNIDTQSFKKDFTMFLNSIRGYNGLSNKIL